jgi:hypothetical protein
MFAKLRSKVLWQYPETTSVETLLRHRRWALRIVYTCAGSGVLAFSSMAHLLLSRDGILLTATIIITCASAAVCLLLFVPAAMAVPWAKDIENALRARGHQLSTVTPIERRISMVALKMCFWFVVLLVLANVLSKSVRHG